MVDGEKQRIEASWMNAATSNKWTETKCLDLKQSFEEEHGNEEYRHWFYYKEKLLAAVACLRESFWQNRILLFEVVQTNDQRHNQWRLVKSQPTGKLNKTYTFQTGA